MIAIGATAWLASNRSVDRRALAASRRWFESLMDRASDLVVVHDATGIIRYASPAVKGVLGYDADELVGRGIDTLLAPGDLEAARAELRRVMTDPALVSRREVGVVHREGHVVTVAVAARNLLDDPAVRGIVVNVRDVTAERRSERQRVETEEHYRAMLDSLPLMVYSVEPVPPYRPRYVSLGHETLGYSRAEWMSPESLWVRSLHPDDRDRVLGSTGEALSAHRDFDETYRAFAKNGDVRWLRDRGRFLYDTADQPTSWLGYMMDVTDLLEAERALRLSEERYRDMFEGDVAANFVTTPDGRVLSCNAAFLNLFGFASVDDVRRTRAEAFYVHSDDRDRWLARVRREGNVEFAEHDLRRADGRAIQVIENARGYFDSDGELVEVHGHITDVTEQRVLQDQLRQAQKLEAIGRLAGGVAHDFNNLLNVISAYATLLGESLPPDAPAQDDVAEIGKSVARGATLTRQLLTFSRHRVPELVHVPVDSAIREAEKMLRRVIPPEIDLQIALGAGGATVFVDAAQVDQILVNLVINAADAMPRGGTLSVHTACLSAGDALTHADRLAPGHYVRLTVADTGVGMDGDTVSRAMEPFFTTKGATGGTGLGLATVYGIVHQAAGDVRIRSEPGVGTSVVVRLPQSGSTDATAARATPAAVPQRVTGGRILVADDEPALLRSLERMLTLRGFTVVAARNGAEALARWDEAGGAFDLVITDVRMPEMSGLDLLRKLRDRSRHQPVLVISGYPEDSSGLPERAARGVAFLEKPFSMSVLLDRVHDLIASDERSVRIALDREPGVGE